MVTIVELTKSRIMQDKLRLCFKEPIKEGLDASSLEASFLVDSKREKYYTYFELQYYLNNNF